MYPSQLLHGPFFGLFFRDLADPHGRQGQVLEHREVGKQVELLKHHANAFADGIDGLDVVAELSAVDQQATLLVFFKSVDAADQSRFARARGAANNNALTFGHAQVDIAQHVEVAKPLVDVIEFDDGVF